MSTDKSSPGGAWHSNGTNSWSPQREPETDVYDSRPDVPLPEERLQEIAQAYPDRAFTPLSEEPGRRLRAEVVNEYIEESTVEAQHPTEEDFTIREVTERQAVCWIDAVSAMLSWYEQARGRRGRIARGRKDLPEYESFLIDLENSWQPAYTKREVARLRAIERETCGGERPSGGEADPAFEEPVTAILTFSASSTPTGDGFAPPVDHDREIADSWRSTYDTLLYQMDALGLDRSDWIYHRQGEPHPGGGKASGYGHTHLMLVLDLASADVDSLDAVRPAMESVVDRHVEECATAGEFAHDTSKDDGPISLRRVGDEGIGEWASYAAEYVSAAEEDLLERSPEYLMWAAVQWATNTQKGTRSDLANAAVRADACKQKYESPESKQSVNHGEHIVRSTRRGVEYECARCGSSWEIDQDHDSLSAARLAAADGGRDLDDGRVQDPGAKTTEEELRSRWPSARGGYRIETRVGKHSGVETHTVSFQRAPRWRMEAVIEADGEERPAQSLGGVDMRPLKLPASTHGWDLPDWVVKHRNGDNATYWECERCGLKSTEPASMSYEGRGHRGGNSTDCLPEGDERHQLRQRDVGPPPEWDGGPGSTAISLDDKPDDVGETALWVEKVLRYAENTPGATPQAVVARVVGKGHADIPSDRLAEAESIVEDFLSDEPPAPDRTPI